MSPIAEISPEQAKRVIEFAEKRGQTHWDGVRKRVQGSSFDNHTSISSLTLMVNGDPVTIIRRVETTRPDWKTKPHDEEKNTLYVGPRLAEEIEKEGIVILSKPEAEAKKE